MYFFRNSAIGAAYTGAIAADNATVAAKLRLTTFFFFTQLHSLVSENSELVRLISILYYLIIQNI